MTKSSSEASEFVKMLADYRSQIDRQTLGTIRGQALRGDVKGAKKGLERTLARIYSQDIRTKTP